MGVLHARDNPSPVSVRARRVRWRLLTILGWVLIVSPDAVTRIGQVSQLLKHQNEHETLRANSLRAQP